jgi:sulfur relay (sulfurtransferase) DsrF/TusC family protein
MKPLALFVVTADPRGSTHAVEAIRIAVGVATWKRVDVALYLCGPAVLAAAENVDDLLDADNLTRYTPLLRDLGRPVYIDAQFRPGLTEASVPIEALDNKGLAQLAGRSNYVLRF